MVWLVHVRGVVRRCAVLGMEHSLLHRVVGVGLEYSDANRHVGAVVRVRVRHVVSMVEHVWVIPIGIRGHWWICPQCKFHGVVGEVGDHWYSWRPGLGEASLM